MPRYAMSHKILYFAMLAFLAAPGDRAAAEGPRDAARALTAPAAAPRGPLATTYQVTVSAAASSAVNAIDPLRTLGAGVDSQNNGAVAKIYTAPNVKAMLS